MVDDVQAVLNHMCNVKGLTVYLSTLFVIRSITLMTKLGIEFIHPFFANVGKQPIEAEQNRRSEENRKNGVCPIIESRESKPEGKNDKEEGYESCIDVE